MQLKKLSHYLTLFILLSTCNFMVSCAQTNNDEKIDEFIHKVKNRFPDIPALGVSVVKDDKVVLIKSYGYADIDKNQKADENTVFYIASTTKSFVGILATILEEEEGKLDLSKPISNYKPFKDFRNKSMYDSISITDLLNHTSGLSNNFLAFRNSYVGNQPTSEMLMLLESTTRMGVKKFEYSNLGYNILDLLIKEELNLDWRDLLEQKIFKPIGMEHTSAYISESKAKKWVLARPYIAARENGKTEKVAFIKTDNNMHAAGGLICTPKDASKWLLFNLNLGPLMEIRYIHLTVLKKLILKR